MKEFESIISFLQAVEPLKSTFRSGNTSCGRQESTAEHSWRLALLCALYTDGDARYDWKRVMIMSLVHDIAEAVTGDIPAPEQDGSESKLSDERRAAKTIFSHLPEPMASEYFAIWEEYNANQTPEAQLVKALDKAETILQHNIPENVGVIDHNFNLDYGKYLFQGEELEQFRQLLDAETARHANLVKKD